MLPIQESAEGISFTVFVQPRSSHNMIVGIHGSALKIKLTAPPVEGAANKQCITYLAKCLGVPKSSLEILSGHTSRAKRVLLKFHEKPAENNLERLKELIRSLSTQKKHPKNTPKTPLKKQTP